MYLCFIFQSTARGTLIKGEYCIIGYGLIGYQKRRYSPVSIYVDVKLSVTRSQHLHVQRLFTATGCVHFYPTPQRIIQSILLMNNFPNRNILKGNIATKPTGRVNARAKIGHG